jgi:rhodanese-related sulfurtransferase
MRPLILLIPAPTLAASATPPGGSALSPAMRTAVAVHQQQFRGYKRGNAELKSRLKATGKYASPDEVQDVIDGKRPGWVVLDIRRDSQYQGGHIASGGKGVLHVGRERPENILERELMDVRNGKQIVRNAPEIFTPFQGSPHTPRHPELRPGLKF